MFQQCVNTLVKVSYMVSKGFGLKTLLQQHYLIPLPFVISDVGSFSNLRIIKYYTLSLLQCPHFFKILFQIRKILPLHTLFNTEMFIRIIIYDVSPAICQVVMKNAGRSFCMYDLCFFHSECCRQQKWAIPNQTEGQPLFFCSVDKQAYHFPT